MSQYFTIQSYFFVAPNGERILDWQHFNVLRLLATDYRYSQSGNTANIYQKLQDLPVPITVSPKMMLAIHTDFTSFSDIERRTLANPMAMDESWFKEREGDPWTIPGRFPLGPWADATPENKARKLKRPFNFDDDDSSPSEESPLERQQPELISEATRSQNVHHPDETETEDAPGVAGTPGTAAAPPQVVIGPAPAPPQVVIGPAPAPPTASRRGAMRERVRARKLAKALQVQADVAAAGETLASAAEYSNIVPGKIFFCTRCGATRSQRKDMLYHYVNKHKNDSNYRFDATCGRP